MILLVTNIGRTARYFSHVDDVEPLEDIDLADVAVASRTRRGLAVYDDGGHTQLNRLDMSSGRPCEGRLSGHLAARGEAGGTS